MLEEIDLVFSLIYNYIKKKSSQFLNTAFEKTKMTYQAVKKIERKIINRKAAKALYLFKVCFHSMINVLFIIKRNSTSVCSAFDRP